MGAGQSYLYINLNNKNQKYFEVVTYNFNYNGKAPTSFDIYIYDSKEAVYDSSYIFGYCSPSSNQVANNVEEQYRKLLLNKTIKFAVGDEATNGVEVIHQEIGEEKKKYRIIYTPKNRDSVLNSLYLEFIDLRKKDICLKRIDQEGCWWAEETINYKDKTSLGSQLGTIKNGLKKVNTVILDVKVSYTGVEVNPDKTTQAYIKYTHTFTSEDEHNFLYGRKIITIGSCLTNVKSKKVEVYYLKAKNKEDEQPFLIEFIPNGEGAQKNKNAYHFTYNEGFDKWTECEEPKVPKTEDETIPKKPDIVEPKPEPEPPPIWLIVGCVAAGVVVIVTLVVVYGIYWYNTTIKLLT
nr:hypothetical protein MACL_00000267 [Theileria orientalis]